MKKVVPDPPLSAKKTSAKSFCTCEESHPPLFTVNPGSTSEDALVHIANLLQGINDTAEAYCEQFAREDGRGMLWSIIHSAESAQALAEGLIDQMAPAET